MFRFKPLPRWHMTGTIPSLYDTESLTSIEQTARLYKTVEDLINDYNKFVEEIEKNISEFETTFNSDYECLKNKLIKIIHEYIKMLDEKIKMQDLTIFEAVKFMKDNILESITSLLEVMKENGEVDEAIANAFENIGTRLKTLETERPLITYDEKDESITIINIGGEENE